MFWILRVKILLSSRLIQLGGATTALIQGISFPDILNMVSWSRVSTFPKFYARTHLTQRGVRQFYQWRSDLLISFEPALLN